MNNNIGTKGLNELLETKNTSIVILILAAGILFSVLFFSCSCDNGTGLLPEPVKEIVSWDSGPSWSPDGKHIAYHHQNIINTDSSYTTGLYLIDTNGQSRHLIIDGNAYSPDWSPDGKRIAYSEGDLFTISSFGDSLFKVTNIGRTFFPSWSPDGKKITFDTPYQDPHGANAIWIINADGTMLHDISIHSTGEWRDPDWSPDGTRIIHYRYINTGTSELFIMNIFGKDGLRVTSNLNEDFAPSWSPNGNEIAWSQNGIWVMKSNGENQRKITDGSNPSWSPDGNMIVYERGILIAPTKTKIVIAILDLQNNSIKNITK